MAVWPVYVEEWQQRCCGEEFVVGDRVSWRLRLEPNWSGFEAVEVDLGDGGDDEAHVGGLHARWEGPGRSRRGVLVEEHHDRPAASTATEGVVRRVRIVRRSFAWSERHGAMAPTTDPIRLQPVDGPAATPYDDEITGWIVDLETPRVEG